MVDREKSSKVIDCKHVDDVITGSHYLITLEDWTKLRCPVPYPLGTRFFYKKVKKEMYYSTEPFYL